MDRESLDHDRWIVHRKLHQPRANIANLIPPALPKITDYFIDSGLQ